MSDKIDADDLHQLERAHIARQRERQGIPASQPHISLALSGGGLRAATYALGVVEALKQAQVWQSLSYVSSVSGGGYAATSSLYGTMSGADLIGRIHDNQGYLGLSLGNVVLLLLTGFVSLLTTCVPLVACIVWALPFATPGRFRLAYVLIDILAPLLLALAPELLRRTRFKDRFRTFQVGMLSTSALVAIAALQSRQLFEPPWLDVIAGLLLMAASLLLARRDRFALRQIPFALGVTLATFSVLTLGFSVANLIPKHWLAAYSTWDYVAGGGLVLLVFMLNPDKLNLARRLYRHGLRRFFLEGVDRDLDGRRPPRSGPFPIINAFVQAPGSGNPLVRDEGGDNFVVTPLHCGSRCTGYFDLSTWVRAGWIVERKYYGLSDLVTASGAALDTRRLGQSKLAGALAVAFNFGLGHWFANPASTSPKRCWARPTYFDNFIALFDAHAETARWIRLSDGGHYENLGLFELVARGADVFVVVDAAHDPNYQFFDLHEATRLCRRHLEATIEIPGLRLGREHARDFYEGTITSRDGKVAKLYYLKLAVADHHPLELRTRSSADPLFPQEPTTNQFLTQAQMMAYFGLGKASAERISPALREQASASRPPATASGRPGPIQSCASIAALSIDDQTVAMRRSLNS